MGRFPFPIPFGWFQIAYPDEVPTGMVRPLHYFGRDLVLWRDEQRAIHLMDAICPHLGAHLGYGGTVEGDAIRCPFHGRKYDGSGTCLQADGKRRGGRAAQMTIYPVVERNGLLMSWYHPHRTPPLWDVPEVAECKDLQFTEFVTASHVVKTAWQEMAENLVDHTHFRHVHGFNEVAQLCQYETRGYFARIVSIR